MTSGSVFAALLNSAKMDPNAYIGAITVNNITRALEPKKLLSEDEIRRSLPSEVHKFINTFMDDLPSEDALPPHRPGIDTKISLQKDKHGRLKEIPWGPLYGMSRDKLLVLRKTLTELLDKN